jgi:hypothetical protein
VLVELYELSPGESERRLESLARMRQRLSDGSRVYATGVRAFFSGLRYGRNEEEPPEIKDS